MSTQINQVGIDALCEAVIMRAVQDYEAALCENDLRTIDSIERFADEGAKYWTTVDMQVVLERIKMVHSRFVQYAITHITDIIDRTIDGSKSEDYSHKDNTNRCPLCGGGLYANSGFSSTSGRTKVCCTGCDLFVILDTPSGYDDWRKKRRKLRRKKAIE